MANSRPSPSARRAPKKSGFAVRTISFPKELLKYARLRARDPQHAGNLSSFLRSLVIEDKAKSARP